MKPGLRKFRSSSLVVSAFTLDVPDPSKVRWISKIETEPADRRQGQASMLLSIVAHEADRHGVMLVLEPKPFNDEPLDRNDLECWYTRRGFQRIQAEPCVLMRSPRQ